MYFFWKRQKWLHWSFTRRATRRMGSRIPASWVMGWAELSIRIFVGLLSSVLILNRSRSNRRSKQYGYEWIHNESYPKSPKIIWVSLHLKRMITFWCIIPSMASTGAVVATDPAAAPPTEVRRRWMGCFMFFQQWEDVFFCVSNGPWPPPKEVQLAFGGSVGAVT